MSSKAGTATVVGVGALVDGTVWGLARRLAEQPLTRSSANRARVAERAGVKVGLAGCSAVQGRALVTRRPR